MGNKILYSNNEDILTISCYGKEMGWGSMAGLTFHRILYLTSVLYVFRHPEYVSPFDSYHFSAMINGPYSEQVSNSLIYLNSDEKLLEKDGMYAFNFDKQIVENSFSQEKLQWIRLILLLLGKYGEDRIFGFIINDPAYDNAVKTNSNVEINVSISSLTVKTLCQFKSSFESTLDDGIVLSDDQYLDLYFEYLFGKIIKGV